MVHLNDSNASDTHFIAQIFSDYFGSVYTLNSKNLDVESLSLPFYDLPNSINFKINDVLRKLENLKENRSVGPDGLSGDFIYGIKSALSFSLWILFNRSLPEGMCPSIWKISSITSIHKSGDKSDIKNYRPISSPSS